MEVRVAQRKAIPALIAIAGTTGSGKTYSALLVASGLAGPQGKVGFVDTEKGRGEMYTDEKMIMEALPGNQYHVVSLDPPFTPARYLQAIAALQQAGCNTIVIDSMTHEWEGEGGCIDIADNNKLGGTPNWAKAKSEHKKFMNTLLSLPVHVVCCLRAREKTKPEKHVIDGKTKTVFVEYGMQPIQEKSFMFEMTFSVLLEATTHYPQPIKPPPPTLANIFPHDKLLNKEVGERIRIWAAGGASTDVKARELKTKLTNFAYDGKEALDAAWAQLTPGLQKAAGSYKTELDSIAADADVQKLEPGREKLF